MARSYPVRLTGPQLRVLRELLSVVMNDPDWGETLGAKDWGVLERVTDTIVGAHVTACRAESIPAR
jgi:hypothetical protein